MQAKHQNPGVELRANVARALEHVLEKRRTTDWLRRKHPEWLQEPLAMELLQGCLRHYFSLSEQINQALRKPLKNKDIVLQHLMLVGAYQLLYLNIPPHAVLNETVEAVKSLRRPWAKGLINAVLRQVQRTGTITKGADQSFDHPDWLQQKLLTQYGTAAEELMRANNQRAPMALRVNQLKCTPEVYAEQLDEAGIAYSRQLLEECTILDAPQAAVTLPGWEQGQVSVQDAGAQLAADALWPSLQAERATVSLLDACAAPGGKLFHLMERLGMTTQSFRVTALETNAERAASMQTLGARLGHNIQPTVADACQSDWWDGQLYTHVLIDAPCSGTGTLRRHPDIKVLLAPEQIRVLARTQLQMLHNLWPMLAPGGTLLYCTCSILAEENDAIVRAFATGEEADSDTSDSALSAPASTRQASILRAANTEIAAVNVEKLQLQIGEPTEFGWQLLPTHAHTDGFYFCLLKKPASTEAVE